MKNFKLGEHPIAVVGMASLMPDAKSLSSYWDNIVDRMVSIVDVPADRWSIDDYYDADPLTPDKTYCKRGAFIPDIEFNPIEYGLPPNILEVTDVSQLLGLVVAKDVLADSGVNSEDDFDHDRIGITLGIGGGQKLSAALTARLQYPVIDKVLKSAGVPDADRQVIVEKYKKNFVPWEENSFPGLLGNVIAGRIANRFNFGGMNSVVDAACASSLSAMKMAIHELVLGNSDLMITGGSCTDNSIFMYMSFSKTPAFTPAEFIKPFDAESNGMMVGEGIGMVALKRLEDAERDGDRIYAVIKGMGSSSDGRFKSIYAPRPEGQAKALKRAYEQAGFEPKTVGLVEAHGTGTGAGDVAEFNSLKSVFSEDNDKKQHIALGSVKSQIGHLKAAAGAAGFIKCALALHHKVLPPTASVKTPNPKLGIEESPFYINAETRPWFTPEDGSPRRAAVSAFGFGGTNFHFVLEEYQQEMTSALRLKHVDHVSLLDATDSKALLAQCEVLLADLESNNNPGQYQSFVEQTRLRDIPEKHARLTFLSKGCDSAIESLNLCIKTLRDKASETSWELPQGISFRDSAMDCKGKMVALFPGQGSQYVRMGDALAQNYPEFREGISKLDELFVKDGAGRLSDIIYPIAAFNKEDKDAQDKLLQQTQHAQPSIGAFSVGAYKLFQQAGLKADFVAGHSFGELSALWAAGVYSEDDFYFLAKARGQAMAAPDDKDFDAGSMMAVSGDVAELEKSLKAFPDIKIANFNSNKQVVIAGPGKALEDAQQSLKDAGFKLHPLPVSAAFHTPLVAHAQKPFAKAIDSVKFSKPAIPVYANGTGKAHAATAAKIKSALKEHILNSVQFRDEIENIYKDGGRIFVEFGPKNVLAKLTENILEGKEVVTFAVNPATGKSADSQLKLLAGKLAVLGVKLKEIDNYAAPLQIHNTEKPSPLNIRISAASYVSDKTRNAFQDSLDDGFSLQKALPAANSPKSEPLAPESKTVSPENATQSQQVNVNAEINLQDFYALQNETLRVHEKYLENPAQYIESFQSLLSQLTQLMDKNPEFVLPESIERSLVMFNEQQQETIKVHESFLKQQAQASQASLQIMSEHYSLLTGGVTNTMPGNNAVPVAKASQQSEKVAPSQAETFRPFDPSTSSGSEGAPVNTTNQSPEPVEGAGTAFDIKALMEEMLTVVAEKTGYPSEMLELDMDMEADLGIDSIKRVEILGSIQEAHPELPELDPEALAELRTLQQIVDYIQEQVAANPSTLQPFDPSTGSGSEGVQAQLQPSPELHRPEQGRRVEGTPFNLQAMTDEMLAVVAEKTGYPSEMLELDMDMEADLGIDSIKRVEILGSIQEAHPELPELDPEALAELRTLQQIVDYIQEQVAANPSTLQPFDPSTSSGSEGTLGNTTNQSPELHRPEQGRRVEGTPFNLQAMTDEMLAVVAEKTGYPSEMLELDMDMEADLGIDSIKRVEILGSIQEAHPELPELDPEALAELRTLRQIVNYIQEQVAANPSASASPAPASPSTSSGNDAVQTSPSAVFDLQAMTNEMLAVVAEKTGYPSEMLELDMDMEADLGIDSIKRVEILGSIQEAHPELPELDPEALAELRTLRQIVDYIQEQVLGASSAVTNSMSGSQSAELVSLDEYKQKHAQQKKQGELAPSRAKVKVKYLPAAEHLLTTVPEHRACIIVSDGSELTRHVVKEYQSLSWKVALVNLPGIKQHESLKNLRNCKKYTLKGFDEDELVTCIEKIESDIGQVANFIYLDAVYKISDKKALAFEEKRTRSLRHLFLFAKHLKTSLNDIEEGTRNAFMAVMHLDAYLGYRNHVENKQHETSFDPVSGAAFGLCKTLRQEWPDVFCRAIDLDRKLKPVDAAKNIILENHDPDNLLAEVGISEDGRITLEAEELSEAPESGSSNQHHIEKESVFLVSGGAKGVTSQCVMKLARQHQCRFILLGRSQLEDQEPEWAQACTGEMELKQAAMNLLKQQGEKPTPVLVEKTMAPVLSQREIKAVLAEIEQVGGQARYLACDVCDGKKLKKLLEQAQDELGHITGLIHGAGVLADKLIEQKTADDFDAVFNTKIAGLGSLFSVINVKALKHLVLFSSAAGFFGNPAQSDYSMANEVLNKLALVFASHFPESRVYSFNWGPWDGGMVTAQLKKLFEARGVELISVDGGAQLFSDYLSAKENQSEQILVGSSMEADISEKKSLKFPDKPIRLKRLVDTKANAFLKDHTIGKQAVLPIVCSAAWHLDGAKACFPTFTFSQVENVQVFKGLSFEGEQQCELIQELSGFSENENTHSLSFKSVIYSEKAGKRINHYGAQVVLSNVSENPVIDPSLLEMSKQRGEATQAVYKDGTLFHGKGLQLLETLIQDSEHSALFKARANAYSKNEQGAFPEQGLNHFSLDVLLQACLVWVKRYKNQASLPLHIGTLTQYKALSAGESFYIELDIQENAAKNVRCNINCFDEQANVIARMAGVELTLSKSLEQKFAS